MTKATDRTDLVELLPCPFCGGTKQELFPPTCTKNDPYNPNDRAFPIIRCMGKGCYIDVPGKDWDQRGNTAWEAWNRRLPSHSTAGERSVGVKPIRWRAYGNQHLSGWQGQGAMGYLTYITDTGPDGEGKDSWWREGDRFDTADEAKAAAQAHYEAAILSALSTQPVTESKVAWQPMETAPRDGKHVLLAVPDGVFVWTVEGSFDGKRWNAVHASDVAPIFWMSKSRLPDDWLEVRAALSAEKGE